MSKTKTTPKNENKFDRCQSCNRWDFMLEHRCPPMWDVIRDGYHDEYNPKKVRADTGKEAALIFAENGFSDWEYPMEMEIWVRENYDDPWQKFNIYVETVPSFYAERIKDDNAL